MTRSILLRLALALAASMLILGLIFHLIAKGSGKIEAAQALGIARNVSLPLALAALACLFGQTLLRAQRYRLLLKADGHVALPRFFPLLLAAAARNMFIDMLPARLGEFSYVALLNRGCGIAASACVSSMALSLFLDFAALLLLVLAPAAWLLVTTGLSLRPAMAIMTLVFILALMGAVLFWGLHKAAAFIEQKLPRFAAWRPAAWSLLFARELAGALDRAKAAGVLPNALFLSLGVRFFKYAGFYLLFLAITTTSLQAMAQARAFEVLSALLSAEAAAAVPIPAFMSFGTYETGGLLCFVALGYAAADSTLAMLAIHIVSQIMDYTLGGAALALFFLMPADGARARQKRGPARQNRAGAIALAGATFAVVLFAALFAGVETLRARKLGSPNPPQPGHAVSSSADELERAKALAAQLKGFVVWSSNRNGNHDIWKMTLPDMAISPLTKHPHAEYFPRISPDGKTLAFCRSKTTWVSQRDPIAWDVLTLNLPTGAETLVAENAVAPSWSEDGQKLFFQRQGFKCVERDMAGGNERTLFEAGIPPVPAGALLETPSVNSKTGVMAATLRGRRRELALFEPGGAMLGLGDKGTGCQLFWAPDGSFLYFVTSRGGNKKNRFMRYDPTQGNTSEWLDMPGDWSHEYFPKLSNNGKCLVFAACADGHEHDTADYEIFLWRICAPPEQAARLTWHTGNDNWPDIYLEE